MSEVTLSSLSLKSCHRNGSIRSVTVFNGGEGESGIYFLPIDGGVTKSSTNIGEIASVANLTEVLIACADENDLTATRYNYCVHFHLRSKDFLHLYQELNKA